MNLRSKRSKKNKKLRYKKNSKKQRGGWDPGYSAGGPDWDWSVSFVEDIVGVVIYGVASLVNGIETVSDLTKLKSDMGTAFHSKNAPSPDSISVPKL